jgi:condensation domain-containing protein
MPDAAAPARGGQLVPLTYEQDRYHARSLRGGWEHRNVRASFRIEGPLDPAVLGEAIRGFVRRHDALQMRLAPGEGGEPAQWIDPLEPGEQVMTAQRLAASSTGQFSRYVEAVFTRDVTQQWDGSRRPFTFRLFQLSERHHALLATFQGMVFDGRSQQLFEREVWRDYHLLRLGRPVPGPAGSFAQAAARQRARSGPPQRERARALWRSRLEFLSRNRWAPLAPAPPAGGDSVESVLDAGATAGLRESCRRNRCTPLQWIASSFVAAVAGQTGRAGVGLWTTFDSRTPADRDVVGMFAGPCPLVVTDARADRHAVLRQTRDQIIGSLRYAQLGWRDIGELVSDLAGPAAAECAGQAVPAFGDIYMNLQKADGDCHHLTAAVPGLRITAGAYPPRGLTLVTHAALHLICDEFRDLIKIKIMFNSERAGRAVAQAVLGAMTHDIAAAVFATQSGGILQ